MSNEILLHIIDGPGTGLTFIVLGFFALIAFFYSVRVVNKGDFQRGKEAARRDSLENIQATLARLVHDQQELKQRIMLESGE